MLRKIIGITLLIVAGYYCSEDKAPKVWEIRGPVWVFTDHERDTVEHPEICFVRKNIDEVDVQLDHACDPPPKNAKEAIALRGDF